MYPQISSLYDYMSSLDSYNLKEVKERNRNTYRKKKEIETLSEKKEIETLTALYSLFIAIARSNTGGATSLTSSSSN